MRCGDPVVRSTNHGSATHVICVPVDEITSAASSAASRRSRRSSRLGCGAEADDDVPRATPHAAAAELVEQRLEPLAELFELRRASARAAPTTSARRAASARAARARAAARRGRAAAAARRARRAARSLRARRSRTRCGRRSRATGRSRPAPPSPSLDEAPFGERAQVVAARGGAVVDDRRALGRRRLVDRVQVVEQRKAGGMRECAHRARVGQGECVLERDLSKLLFREPGVKHPLLLRPGRGPPASRPGASPLRDPRRACRAPSPRAAASRGPRRMRPTGRPRASRRTPGSISQSGSSIHSPTSCSARKSPSTQTSSASLPATRRQVSNMRRAGRRPVDGVVRARGPALGGAHDPVGEVAHVDHLRVRHPAARARARGRRRRCAAAST